MVRAGLSVPAAVLGATERLMARTRPQVVWGMAPFGGDAGDPLWSRIDASPFLEPGQGGSPIQAVVAAAWAIPSVERPVVGTSSSTHLEEGVQAEALTVSTDTVARYLSPPRRRAERVDT